jgi:hypothetical protein
VASAADHEAVNAALDRVVASVPTSEVIEVHNAFSSVVAVKAFCEFKDVVEAA